MTVEAERKECPQPPKLEEAKTDPSLKPLEGAWLGQYLDFEQVILISDSGLQNYEKINFCKIPPSL